MSAQRLDQFLRGLPEALAQPARRLAVLQRAYSDVVPPALAASSRAGAFHEGRLTLFATNGAVAAKLKQVLPGLLLGLRELGWEINVIEVRVQVSGAPARAAPREKNARKISAQGLRSLTELANRLPASPLRSAVENLLAAQRRRPGHG
jgi:predicted transcriptional regulator